MVVLFFEAENAGGGPRFTKTVLVWGKRTI